MRGCLVRGSGLVDFKVLLDDLGIETASAWCLGSRVRVYEGNTLRHREYGAVRVVPVSAQSTTSGALKGAAWGLFLAGPVGAAVGSMVGGGTKVAFEIHTLENEVLPCLAGKGAYLKIKKQIEAKPAQPGKMKARKERPEFAMRNPGQVGPVLIIGMALVPFIAVWFFFTKGFTPVARVLAVAWTIFWIVGLSQMDRESEVAAPTDATPPVAATTPSS